jgi:hypothetical protein
MLWPSGFHSSEGTNLFSKSVTLCTFPSPTLSSALAPAFEKPESVEYDDCHRSMSRKCATDSVCSTQTFQISSCSLGPIATTVTGGSVVLTGWCSGNALHCTFGKCSVRISIGTLAILAEVFRGFSAVTPYKYQDSITTRPWLLPSKSVPIYYPSCYLSALCSLATDREQNNQPEGGNVLG